MAFVTMRQFWLLFALLANIVRSSESQETCASQLANQVVFDGQPADFYSADATLDCQWKYSPSSDFFRESRDITDDSGNFANPVYDEFYTVSSTDLGMNAATGDPIIESGSLSSPDSTAGVYVLQCPSCTTAANLITVYNSGSSCVCDPIAEMVTCSITYAESQIQPSHPTMTWSDSSGNSYTPDTPTAAKNTKDFTATSQLPINVVGASDYTCQVTFNAPEPFPYHFLTTDAPTFTTSCSVANCLQDETTQTNASPTTTADPCPLGEECMFDDFDDCLNNTNFGGVACGECFVDKRLCEQGVPEHLTCDAFCKRNDPKSIGSCEDSVERRCPCLMPHYKACFCVTKRLRPESESPNLSGCFP